MSVSLKELISKTRVSSVTLNVNGLYGACRGLFISSIVREEKQRAFFCICPTEEFAEKLLADVKFFLSGDDATRLVLFREMPQAPYSRISPEPSILAERLYVLERLDRGEPLVVFASAAACIRKIPPKIFLSDGRKSLKAGSLIDLDELVSFLSNFGYEDAGLVEDEGSFARRGGIIDIWPPAADLPTRIELDGEKIVSMSTFDPASQRRTKEREQNELLLFPAKEIPFDADSRNTAAHRVRERTESPLTSGEKRSLIEAIHEGVSFTGIETLLPLFHKSTETLFDYAKTARVMSIEPIEVEAACDSFIKRVTDLFAETKSPERIISPNEIILSKQEFISRLESSKPILVGNASPDAGKDVETISPNVESNLDLRRMIESHKKGEDMLSPLARLIVSLQSEDYQVLITCHTEIQAERLSDLFHLHSIDLMRFDAPFDTLGDMVSSFVKVKIGRLSSGFRWKSEKLAIITDEEIFGEKITRKPSASKPSEPFMSLADIAEKDLIVHELHGIGRYLGLSHLTFDGKSGDFLILEYMGGDKLYLPVYRLNLVGRYIGSPDAPPLLDKLGGIRWANVQSKVKQEIGTIAKELLRTFAERKIHSKKPFESASSEYEEFAASFPYDETPDQTKAIEDLMRDMDMEKPSDRLICGDVGYGKTEVAMRAAFRAAASGRQVAVLVPTTVLALQHFETFQKRFHGTPLNIAMLSRFVDSRTRKKIVEDVKKGIVDVIVGTHRLLQKDVSFKDLGLLIIDEEHRFGVKHKERIKKFKSTVDVVSLSATPIPRTLNMSLSGIRDISVINTPPADRLSISTYVVPFDEGIIRHAILAELARGGQVFLVHNRVETIGSMHARIKKLVPEARIVVGHGKMKESELENVMISFMEREADVLLCTTIIESGLDIPNANTIIINRADMFGLADLYQLRGRVGRSNVRAHAYLLIPEDREITLLAKKRLSVIKRYTELGSGFQIAMHDLEFRGAGNILGSAQSGHINAIGYELYSRLLDRTIRKLKGEKVKEEVDPELSISVNAFLPESYVTEPGQRIEIYRRLATRENEEDIGDIQGELIDRFGTLPIEAECLLQLMAVKVLAKKLGASKIQFDGHNITVQLSPEAPIDMEKLVSVMEKERGRIRIVPPDRLLITSSTPPDSEFKVLEHVKNSLRWLFQYVTG